MKLINDMNVHLTYDESYHLTEGTQTTKAASGLKAENKMSILDYSNCLDLNHLLFRKSFQSANFMFFNPTVFDDRQLISILDKISVSYPNSGFTALIDFRNNDCLRKIENLVSLGFSGIKFHPYSQEILESDWERILEVSKVAEKNRLLIYVCTSFGTSKMHKHNGMGLACKIAENIRDTPIILLHSGGTKIYEAMLLADDQPNIYLETSFSLNYLENSPLWDDIAYVYKKIGSTRVLFGSDYPYISFNESLDCIERFLEKYKFTEEDKINITFRNFENLIKKYRS